MSEYETWKNVTQGTVMLQVLQPNGSIQHRAIAGGLKAQIKKDDRHRNEAEVAKEEWDPFLNGTLVQVQHIMETDSDVDRALQPNPNHLTEDDIAGILGISNGNTFNKRIRDIDSVVVLTRLHTLASDDDEVPEARVTKITERLAELGEVVPTKVTTVAAAPAD